MMKCLRSKGPALESQSKLLCVGISFCSLVLPVVTDSRGNKRTWYYFSSAGVSYYCKGAWAIKIGHSSFASMGFTT